MTRVCIIGAEDATLPADLLSYPTARDALDAYDLEAPFANTVAIETISIGAAVSLLNDLDWYLVRLADEALVLEPSVSETEWLSRTLAMTVRNETVEPEATGTYLKIYGVEQTEDGQARLVEPLFAQRVDGEVPEYDLRDVEDTLVVRVTTDEFGA
jgi:hypothetical protein